MNYKSENYKSVGRNILNNQLGFTLVEMIVVTGIFVMVIMLASESFKTILNQSIKLRSSEESNIEGVVGLEMMRHDIEQAGFGLPWVSMDNTFDLPNYNEAASAPHREFNDGLPRPTAPLIPLPVVCQIPRAIVTGNNLAFAPAVLTSTDYISVKATSVGQSNAAQRWTFVTYSGLKSTPIAKAPVVMPAGENIPTNTSVIVTRREMVQLNGVDSYASKLIYNPASVASLDFFSQPFPSPTNALPLLWSPQRKEHIHYIYGVDLNSDQKLRMPFNRANFFVMKPTDVSQIPKTCASNTGTLYKTTVNHADGLLNYIPILDCVADMQIILGFDLDGTGQVSVLSNANGSTVIGTSATFATPADMMTAVQATLADSSLIRDRLKVIKIYVLAQEGRRDPGYTSPTPIAVRNTAIPGEASLTNNYNLVGDALHYRWKVYKIIARPKNITNK